MRLISPCKEYPKMQSKEITIFRTKNKYITIVEHYGDNHELNIRKWVRESKDSESFIWKDTIKIPLNKYARMIQRESAIYLKILKLIKKVDNIKTYYNELNLVMEEVDNK